MKCHHGAHVCQDARVGEDCASLHTMESSEPVSLRYEPPDWDAEFEFCDEMDSAALQAPGPSQQSGTSWTKGCGDFDSPCGGAAHETRDVEATQLENSPAGQQQQRSKWACAPDVETVNVPHCQKAKFGGEDAFFTCWSKDGMRLAFGVADGVGGSRSDDDPEALVADWVREVTRQLADLLSNQPELEIQQAVLQVLLGMPEAAPSTTLCFGILEPGKLKVFNLGDSRLAVFRGAERVFITEPQQYPDCWNAPLQVRGGPLAAADLEGAVVSEVEILPGDVIVTGTDGLWDNIWTGKVAALVGDALADRCGDAAGIAKYIADEALANRHSTDAIIPFHVAFAEAHGLSRDDIPLGGKEDDLTLQVVVVPEVVMEEEAEPAPCRQHLEEEGTVPKPACCIESQASFFDSFHYGEEEDDDDCSSSDLEESFTYSPARAAAFLPSPCDPATDTTCKVSIITSTTSSSNSGACGQAVPESMCNINRSPTGVVVGQGPQEGAGAYALPVVALGMAATQGFQPIPQVPPFSSAFEAVAAEGFTLSPSTSFRSEALLGLSPQSSWAPQALDAATAPAVAAVAAAAALSVLAASPAAGYSSEEEGEGSDCSTGSNFSECSAFSTTPAVAGDATRGEGEVQGSSLEPSSCISYVDDASGWFEEQEVIQEQQQVQQEEEAVVPQVPAVLKACSSQLVRSTAAAPGMGAATAFNPMENGADIGYVMESGCSFSTTSDERSSKNGWTRGDGSSYLLRSGCSWGWSDGGDNTDGTSGSAAAAAVSGSGRLSPIILWDVQSIKSNSSSSSTGSLVPSRQAWCVFNPKDVQCYSNSVFEQGTEVGFATNSSSGSDKDSVSPQDLEGPLRCSSDREAPGVTSPPLCAQVGTATTSPSSSSKPQQQSSLPARSLLGGTRVTPRGDTWRVIVESHPGAYLTPSGKLMFHKGGAHSEIEPLEVDNIDLAQQQQQQQQEEAATAASASLVKPSGWGTRVVQAVAQRLRCMDNSRAAAADAAASHLQQQERSRLAGAKGAGVRSAAQLYVIEEGEFVGSNSSSGAMPLQAAAATQATLLPGGMGMKKRQSSSSGGSSSLSRGGSNTLSALEGWVVGGLGQVGEALFKRRSTSGGSPDAPAKAIVATTITNSSSSGSKPVVAVAGVSDPVLSGDSTGMKYGMIRTKAASAHQLAGDTTAVAAAASANQLAQSGGAAQKKSGSKSGSIRKIFSGWGLGCLSQPKVVC